MPEKMPSTAVTNLPSSLSVKLTQREMSILRLIAFGFTNVQIGEELHIIMARADEFLAKGVDTVACVSVNDPFVMGAWGRDQEVGDRVLMLADGNGEFTGAMGLEADMSGAGLGPRSQRYAAVVEDGVVTALFVEPERGLNVSSAESVLSAL